MMSNVAKSKAEMELRWSLTDDGMGFLERAGLGGLYLSLAAVDKWADDGDADQGDCAILGNLV
jgi:hypothetical protein